MMFRRTLFVTLLTAGLSAVPGTSRALPFEPGEEVALSVSIFSVGVGNIHIVVHQDQVDGQTVWPIQMRAKTAGLAGAFYKVDDTMTTRFDPATRRSLGSEFLENFGDFHNKETVKFTTESATVRRDFKGTTNEQVHPIQPGSTDILSAVYALRDLPLQPGNEYRVPIFTGHRNWEMIATVSKVERVKTDAGKFDAIQVRCRTLFGGKFSTQGDMVVWFSNDDRRIPVKMTAPFALGTMEASLTSYHAGPFASN
jgi:hypothetical protein